MTQHFITVNNKRYDYDITPDKGDEGFFFIKCKGAGISQYYPREDIFDLLEDLPNLIIDETAFQKEQKKSESKIYIRVKMEEKKAIQKNAKEKGYSSTSAYLRSLALASNNLAPT